MFCKNCGKEISDEAVICPNCGVPVQKEQAPVEQKNTIATVGLVLSFFVSVVGLILSIVGLKKSAELNGAGKKVAIAGIVISAIEIVTTIIVYASSYSLILEYMSQMS